ncbi:hypothetical protein Aph01nite_33260 [Acrocarpospora phusangensis]|uniref:Uncharacterized protein n=1 Tax=Acrocarpospora phusangensis TaxID=1070424 RepID=A0A919QA39_9ACTN|nr:hypothetical protein Aph01nite_33260 [Acrocarpospora phusangensis]
MKRREQVGGRIGDRIHIRPAREPAPRHLSRLTDDDAPRTGAPAVHPDDQSRHSRSPCRYIPKIYKSLKISYNGTPRPGALYFALVKTGTH